MNTFLAVVVMAVVMIWLGYSFYRLWRVARGGDCSNCASAGTFDYKNFNGDKKEQKPQEFVTAEGHRILLDEDMAHRRQERLRKMQKK